MEFFVMAIPYIEYKKNNKLIRTFKDNVNENELVWHKDKKNRTVEVIHSNGWFFQLDNEYPVELKNGDYFFVPNNTYHRIIKGNGDLIVSIIEE